MPSQTSQTSTERRRHRRRYYIGCVLHRGHTTRTVVRRPGQPPLVRVRTMYYVHDVYAYASPGRPLRVSVRETRITRRFLSRFKVNIGTVVGGGGQLRIAVMNANGINITLLGFFRSMY